MGFFMIVLLIMSGLILRLCDFSKDVGAFFKAQKSDDPTYTDSKGNLRNKKNAHSVYVDIGGREYDSWDGKMLYNPHEENERQEKENVDKLGYSKYRVYGSRAEEIDNDLKYGHPVIYKSKNNDTPYGKLNCNLGYQFWVNLNTGYMEETELSKMIPHTELKKYHKKPIDNRKRKVQKYVDDRDHPYNKEELTRENEKILKHLNNHNRNIVANPNMDKTQKFCPHWCYKPKEKWGDLNESQTKDGLIFKYEMDYKHSILTPKQEEGWND